MEKTFIGLDSYKKALAKVISFIEDYKLELTYLEIKKSGEGYVAFIKYDLGLR